MTGDAVLRVLTGRLAGTERALPAAGRVSIGHEFWQDVVIRDPATKGSAIDLVRTDGGAQVTVLSGTAELLGSKLEAGQTALLPPYVPVSIGGVALAWGDPANDRWQEADGLAATQPAPPSLPAPASDRALEALDDVRGRLVALGGRPRVVAILGAALILVVLLVSVPKAVAGLGLFGTPVTRAERTLAKAGFPHLAVAPRNGGDGVTVSGFVAGEAQRTRVRDALGSRSIDAELRLQTNADLARGAAEAARIQGIHARARPLGLRVVELRTVLVTEAQRDRLIAAIRSDVPGIRRLNLRGDLPPADEVPLRTIADATKKVSTVVAGDPSYIQTIDGARYFRGAMLPSGHRLVGIQGNMVVMEKGGRETRVAF